MSELSPEAKRLMQVAHESFTPSAQRAARVHSALTARLAADGKSSAGAEAAALATRGWSAWRLVGIGVAAVGLTTGAIMLSQSDDESAARATVAAEQVSTNAASRADVLASARNALQVAATPNREARVLGPVRSQRSPLLENARIDPVHARDIGHAAGVRASSPQAHDVARAAASHASTALRAAEPSQVNAHQTPSGLRAKHENVAEVSAADVLGEAESTPVPAPVLAVQRATSTRKSAPLPDDALKRELQLISRANAALTRHDGRAALALADQHAALFPNGRLSQERVAVRALALCALGQNADARLAAAELERIAPRSPHLMRLRDTCLGPRAAQP